MDATISAQKEGETPPTGFSRTQGARIIRPTSRNAFAVVFDGYPSVAEIHCSTIDAGDRREFNALVRALPKPGTYKPEKPCCSCWIPITVDLGKYCFQMKAWTGCTLHFSQSPDS